jgi:hypothetical protein
MKFTSTLILSSLLLASACGGGGGGSAKKKPNHQEHQTPVVIDLDIDAAIDGQYLAIFETINPQITSKITGAFTFSREKDIDEVVGDIRLTNAGPALLHAQNVRLGTRCPIATDDTNGDGIIDAKEGEAVYGKIYFPLDGDLASASSHDGEFPVGDVYGNYIWARVTKFTKFISDLRSADNSDGYFKLAAKEPMDLEGRVVVIHGVDAAAGLPATVGSVGRSAAHQALPIACGVIGKVLGPPGSVDDGSYPPEVIAEIPETL